MTTGSFAYKRPSSVPIGYSSEVIKQLIKDARVYTVLAKWRHKVSPGLISEKGLLNYTVKANEEAKEDRFQKVVDELALVPEAMQDLHRCSEAMTKWTQMGQQQLTHSVRNGRLLREPSLDTNGFLLKRHVSQIADWADDTQIVALNKSELAELVREELGASHAVCGDFLKRQTGGEDPLSKIMQAQRGAVFSVHNDFTETYGEAMIEEFRNNTRAIGTFGLIQEMRRAGWTEELIRSSRMVVVNTWRSISDYPCRRNPLAVADRRSVKLAEISAAPLTGPNGKIDATGCEPSPQHEWYYFPDQTKDEVLLIKTYDSEEDPFFPTLHSSFEDPLTPADYPERRSVEARVLALVPVANARLAKGGPKKKMPGARSKI